MRPVGTHRPIVPQPPVSAETPSSLLQAWDTSKAYLDMFRPTMMGRLDSHGQSEWLMGQTHGCTNQMGHCLGITQKFAPPTLQSYIRIWTRWVSFSDSLKPLAYVLDGHANGPMFAALEYREGLAWMYRASRFQPCMMRFRHRFAKLTSHQRWLHVSCLVFLEKDIVSWTFCCRRAIT